MPKLADAWIQLSTKGIGNVNRDLGQTRTQIEATSASFNRGTSIMVRSAERPYRALRRIFNILKEVAQQTEEGKAAVEDADHAWGGLINQMVAAVTGGEDMTRVFEILASLMRSLTRDTDEWKLAIQGVVKQILEARMGLGWLLGDTAADSKAILQQIDDLNRDIKERNNDLTKRDVQNAQKRADAAKKESAAKRAEFFSLEEVYKDAQRRLIEKQSGMNVAEPAAPGEAPDRRGLAIPAGRRAPAGPSNISPFTGISRQAPPLYENEGAKHEYMDFLEQSNRYEDRREAERMRRDEKALKVLQNIDKNTKGGAKFGK